MEVVRLFAELAATCAATFIGAYAAFKLEENSRRREKTKQQASEGNLALQTILLMWNKLRQYQVEAVETAPTGVGRWIRVKATLPHPADAADLRFDPARLDFLFECENKNILPQVLMEGAKFQLAITMINRRGHLMLETVYPKLSAAGVENGQSVTEADVRRILGSALWVEGEQLTEGLLKIINEDVASLRKTFDDLREQLLKRLPGEKFIKVNFSTEPETH